MTEVLFPKNPYVGPRSFQKGEQLYGRERELQTLFYLLSVDRVVLFHSASGAGKTSLVQARLIDMLEDEGFHVLPIMRVGAEPLANLPGGNRYVMSALQCLEEPLALVQRVAPDRLDRLTFGEYLRQRPGALDDYSREVLIFDQFEEILTVDPNDRTAKEDFFTEVGEVLRDHRRWALFIIREEYVGAIEPYTHLITGNLDCRFRLDLLDVNTARYAIRQPAAASGVDFTEEAATSLLDNLRTIHFQQQDGTTETRLGAYVEPVQLQVVCRQLWEALAQRRRQGMNDPLLEDLLAWPIDLQEASAGNTGTSVPAHPRTNGALAQHQSPNERLLENLLARPAERQVSSTCVASATRAPARLQINVEDLSVVGDVDHALSSYYDEQISAVVAKGVRERFLREWIERWLITSEGLRSQVLRRAHATEQLPDDALTLLINAHIVREERRLGGKWCELTHDRLIEPIRQSNRQWLEQHLHPLQIQAKLWQQQGEPRSMLLRDDALDAAIRWAKTSADNLTRDERHFLRMSREAQRKTEQRRLEQLREQEDARRIRRLGLSVGALGAVIAVLMTIIVLLNYREDQLQRGVVQAEKQINTQVAVITALHVRIQNGDPAAERTAIAAQQTITAANTTIVLTLKLIDRQEQPASIAEPSTPSEPPVPSTDTPVPSPDTPVPSPEMPVLPSEPTSTLTEPTFPTPEPTSTPTELIPELTVPTPTPSEPTFPTPEPTSTPSEPTSTPTNPQLPLPVISVPSPEPPTPSPEEPPPSPEISYPLPETPGPAPTES